MSSTAVHGFGGVRLEIPGTGLSATFLNRKAYCSIGYKPEGWEQYTDNGDLLWERDGFRAILTAFFENVETGDYLIFEELIQIINTSINSGFPVRVYPKWNPLSPTSIYFDCKIMNQTDFQDVSTKVNVGQKIPNIEFNSVSRLDQMPFFTDGVLPAVATTSGGLVISTSDGKVIQIV